MKTSEFIYEVEKLGLNADQNVNRVLIMNEEETIAFADAKRMFVMDTDTRFFGKMNPHTKSKLIKLMIDYITTTIEEREQEKRYYLKLITPILIDNDEVFLNVSKAKADYFIRDKEDTRYDKTIFTESELSQMDETGFTRILVEEEEK